MKLFFWRLLTHLVEMLYAVKLSRSDRGAGSRDCCVAVIVPTAPFVMTSWSCFSFQLSHSHSLAFLKYPQRTSPLLVSVLLQSAGATSHAAPPPITTPYVVQSGASHQSCRSHNGHTSISPVLSVAGTLASDLHCLLLYAAPFTLCLSQARSLLFLWYRALLLVIICLSLFFFPFQPLLL